MKIAKSAFSKLHDFDPVLVKCFLNKNNTYGLCNFVDRENIGYKCVEIAIITKLIFVCSSNWFM